LLKQTFYGFRVHVRVCWPGLISRISSVAPANVHELSVLPELTEFASGIVVGDRNHHSPRTAQELERMGVELLTPYSSKKRDPAPKQERSVEPFSLRHRHRLFAAHRAILYKASVGQEPLAPGWQAAEEGLESHRCLPVQPPDKQSASSALQALHLKNPHIGLATMVAPTSFSPDTIIFLSLVAEITLIAPV
jgi:hypothetical protein